MKKLRRCRKLSRCTEKAWWGMSTTPELKGMQQRLTQVARGGQRMNMLPFTEPNGRSMNMLPIIEPGGQGMNMLPIIEPHG